MSGEKKEKPELIAKCVDPETNRIIAWSLAARKYVPVLNARIVLMKNGRPRLAGTCSVTGKGVSQMLPPFPKAEVPE